MVDEIDGIMAEYRNVGILECWNIGCKSKQNISLLTIPLLHCSKPSIPTLHHSNTPSLNPATSLMARPVRILTISFLYSNEPRMLPFLGFASSEAT